MPKKTSQGPLITQYVERFPGKTATQIAKMLGFSTASVSSYLTKQVRIGALYRGCGGGPRGGFVYYPPHPTPTPKTLWERILDEDSV